MDKESYKLGIERAIEECEAEIACVDIQYETENHLRSAARSALSNAIGLMRDAIVMDEAGQPSPAPEAKTKCSTPAETEAIRTLVGPIEVDEAARNPNVFNERIEAAIGKIMNHYEVMFMPVALNWQMGGRMQTQMIIVPKQKAEVDPG